jgi:hypothetical protein
VTTLTCTKCLLVEIVHENRALSYKIGPVTVGERYKACSDAGIVDSNPSQGMDI